MMMTLDFRPEVERWSFHAFHNDRYPMQYNYYLSLSVVFLVTTNCNFSLWTWIWGRYHRTFHI